MQSLPTKLVIPVSLYAQLDLTLDRHHHMWLQLAVCRLAKALGIYDIALNCNGDALLPLVKQSIRLYSWVSNRSASVSKTSLMDRIWKFEIHSFFRVCQNHVCLTVSNKEEASAILLTINLHWAENWEILPTLYVPGLKFHETAVQNIYKYWPPINAAKLCKKEGSIIPSA